ncbi:hypothetical protein M5D96_008683 [Drosophila gunungcola]|uniref:Uncharacterized protein n=1 Tax=Drosophila gunungcola TaxID=103775 RepID=A0A9P9YLA9_9MUSC|nr:hypothetical protein M5D96_008683 [Drosophila gunungcola]
MVQNAPVFVCGSPLHPRPCVSRAAATQTTTTSPSTTFCLCAFYMYSLWLLMRMCVCTCFLVAQTRMLFEYPRTKCT